MLTVLDHIIIGVNDLAQAERTFSEKLGLAVSGGGTHPSGGTANRIIVIDDTYLELITIRTPAEAQLSMLERLAQGDGYLNFVLSSNDIQADTDSMKKRRNTALGPMPGQLKSAGGQVRSWLRTDVELPDLTQRYPFILQHDSIGEERRFKLAGWATPPDHPLGAKKVMSTTIAVADLGEATFRFQRLYGLKASETFTGEADGWDAMLVSFPLIENGQSFELATPLPLSLDREVDIEHLPGPGALARYLARFGESLCRMTLAVENLAASRQYLDERQVTYTYVENAHPVLWIHPDDACGASIVLHEFDTEFVLSVSGFPDE